jgi:hypothetical protein
MDYIVDIETDGVNPSKIHCMSFKTEYEIHTYTDYVSMTNFITALSQEDRIIGHNFIRYDAPVIERILGIKIKAKIVDTLALSWYLYQDILRHGLEQWGERLGIAKPKVEDWENACIQTYVHRCEEDVKINYSLWCMERDYLNSIYTSQEEQDRIIRYLSFKMTCAQMQEKSRWKLDIQKAEHLLSDMKKEYDEIIRILKAVMPKVEKTAIRKRPAKPYKQDGTLSATGKKWKELCELNNMDFDDTEQIEVIVGFEEPNPISIPQLKSWLYSLGWSPITYDYRAAPSDNKRNGDNPDKKKAVPQIKLKTGDMCESVKRLIPDHEEVKHLENLTILKHRIGTIEGFLKNVDSEGYLVGAVGGLTNTMRFTHRVCVNIPSARKPYGSEIRELLTVSKDDNVLCGSDLASLEDRTKQHYMWDYDPDFVKDMQVEGFDPHLDLALSAGAVTQEQVDAYKSGEDKSITSIRHTYKGGNYACTYGAGVVTLSRQLGISKSEATKIHKAYWNRNWSLKQIAKDSKVKAVDGNLWLLNPVSKLWYPLRAEKDIFSTLNQGTGTYCFDVWLGFIIKERPQLTAQFHDEVILELNNGEEDEIENILKKSIANVNKLLKLNRDLDCDVQFGKNYSQIH